MEEEAEVAHIGRGVGVEWVETQIFETGLKFFVTLRPSYSNY